MRLDPGEGNQISISLIPSESETSDSKSGESELNVDFTDFCEAWLEAYEQINAHLSGQDIGSDHPDLEALEACRTRLSDCIESSTSPE